MWRFNFNLIVYMVPAVSTYSEEHQVKKRAGDNGGDMASQLKLALGPVARRKRFTFECQACRTSCLENSEHTDCLTRCRCGKPTSHWEKTKEIGSEVIEWIEFGY